MFYWSYLSSLRSRYTRRKSRPKSVRSFSISTPPSYHTHTIQICPLTATSRVPAVTVDESDLYSALDGIFGAGAYKVYLDRDVYRIAASRKLTPSERRRFSGRINRLRGRLAPAILPHRTASLAKKWAFPVLLLTEKETGNTLSLTWRTSKHKRLKSKRDYDQAFQLAMRLKARAKEAWRKLGNIRQNLRGEIHKRRGRRDECRHPVHPTPLPENNGDVRSTNEAVSYMNRNPPLDAIHGNDLIWGVDGVPGSGTLKTCDDGGNALLFQSDTTSRGDVSSEPMAFGQLGAQFENEDPFNPPPTIEGLDPEDDPETAAKNKLAKMNVELLERSLKPFKGPEFYVPIDALHSVISRDAIRTILPAIAKGVEPPDLYDLLAQDIFGHVLDSKASEKPKPAKSFCKILAVLIIIGKAESILDFVKADIDDKKLPLQKLGDNRLFRLACLEKDPHDESPSQKGKLVPILLFASWARRDVEAFETNQWGTLAPFFSRGKKEDSWVHRYELSWQHPLPFEIISCREDNIGTDGKGTTSTGRRTTTGSRASGDWMRGGNSKLWKVKIHAAHHDLKSYTEYAEDPTLVIKRLSASDRATFNNEVHILTRLNKCNDPHLVKLLLTMEISECPGRDESTFFLMFPYADGNLRQFWRRNSPSSDASTMAECARWVAKQFHGLVCALCKLHDLHHREVHSLREGENDGRNSTGDSLYGIHGDIKPENLLWYRKWIGPRAGEDHSRREERDDVEPFGVLQLADFGISKLHRSDTRSSVDMRKSTKTYAPPETEWGVNECSRSFDIWSLGCVFLEFICWLVQSAPNSNDPVDVFHNARYLDGENVSLSGTVQDTFYHWHTVKVKDGSRTKFKINPAVTELVKTLKTSPKSSEFVHEMLDIILYEMLVIQEPRIPPEEPTIEEAAAPQSERINSLDLKKKLYVMVWKGRGDDAYFAKPRPTSQNLNKDPQAIIIPESATELVQRRRSMIRSFPPARNKGEGHWCDQRARASTIHEVPSPY